MCKPNWYHDNNGSCFQCPSRTYAVQDKIGAFCIKCHYTCLSCKGPSDTDCITCHEDSTFILSNSAERCVLNNISWKMQSTVWYYRMAILFLINTTLMIVFIIYSISCWYIRRHKHTHQYSQVSYTDNGKARADIGQLQGDVCVSDSE